MQFELENRLAASWPCSEWRDCHVLIAVSGGADSVALLRAVAALKRECGGPGAVYVAHLNHGLRGEAADADEGWVEALCQEMGLAVSVGRADVGELANQAGDGWEAAARLARYDFLRTMAEQIGARFVATAHTADDQVETVLHHILRGTGLAGLAGIPPTRPLSPSVTLVRPLLRTTRGEIVEYLKVLKQNYRSDASNADVSYTRNRIRQVLLPLIRDRFNSEVDAALLRLAGQASEAQHWLGGHAQELVKKCVTFAGSSSTPARLDQDEDRHDSSGSKNSSAPPPSSSLRRRLPACESSALHWRVNRR